MSKLKVFSLGTHGFVRPEVIEALGDNPWNRQAEVLISAKTKKMAAELSTSRGIHISPTDPEMRLVSGIVLDALLEAGFFQEEEVIVNSKNTWTGPVVRIQEDKSPEVIGHFVLSEDKRSKFFVRS